jgi:hypothetical protein
MSTFYLLPEDEKTPSPRHDRRLLGQKAPFKPREVWAIRALLHIQGRMPVRSIAGLPAVVMTRTSTERTRYVAPRRR